MKKFILISFAFLFGLNILAQDADSTKALTRKEKKEIKQQESNEKLKNLHALLNSKMWIIKAEQVNLTAGEIVTVNQELNFVYVMADNGVVQLALQELMGIGLNNIGGVTVEGEVAKYNLAEFEDNKQVSCMVQIDSKNGGFVQLQVSVMANGNATVKVNADDGNNFAFTGYLSPLGGEHIIKGSSAK